MGRPKGNQVKIPELEQGNSGDAKTARYVLARTEKSSLFFLTAQMALESACPAIEAFDGKGVPFFGRFRTRVNTLETLACWLPLLNPY